MFDTKLMIHYYVLRIPVVDTAVVVAETKEMKILHINNKIILIWNKLLSYQRLVKKS